MQQLGRLLPAPIKVVARFLYRPARSALYRPARSAFRALKTYHPQRRIRLRQYWRNPWGGNAPEFYLEGAARSRFLAGLVEKYTSPPASILEIGCNVGRNLDRLRQDGHRNLYGIELNGKALRIMRKAYPDLARQATIHHAPVEDVIKSLGDGAMDTVFTMAVLMHLPPESAWVFDEIARVTKKTLIVIEDEGTASWKHFPRSYRTIFQELGMRQAEEISCAGIEGLEIAYVARVFEKNPRENAGGLSPLRQP